jgi:glycopeptide antibiotics resistance protein
MTTAILQDRQRVLTLVLFAVYAAVLVSVVLFKFPFIYDHPGDGRVINLIPFKGSFTANGAFHDDELVENIVFFVPLGVYLSAVTLRWAFWHKALVVLGVSVSFEVIQYLFDIGHADVTDVIANTLGGVIGIGIYAVLAKVFRSRTRLVFNVAALILTVVVLAFLIFLRSHSR